MPKDNTADQRAEGYGPGFYFAEMVCIPSQGCAGVLILQGTVISINENPFPHTAGLNGQQEHELNSIRHNSLNVLSQLSNATDQEDPLNPIMTVQVRAGRKSSMAESHISDDDSPSLLLYYLFDDWYTSYSLVAKSDHEYRRQLDLIVRRLGSSNYSH